MKKHLQARHGVIYSQPDTNRLGYFGWPTVARLTDGTLVAAASGFRNGHVCPFGKSVLFRSNDDGKTWSDPEVVNNSPIDDRDCGLLALDDNAFMLTWFTSDTAAHLLEYAPKYWNELNFFPLLRTWGTDMTGHELGSFFRICDKNGKWSKRTQIVANAPHGPVRLSSGRLVYMGMRYGVCNAEGAFKKLPMKELPSQELCVVSSDDNGHTWFELGMPPTPVPPEKFYCEPHVIELKDGRLLAMIRVEYTEDSGQGFAVGQSISGDGGLTWSQPVIISKGSPPHLMRHSSGSLVCTIGWREAPDFGQRALFSGDEGETWHTDWIIRDDGIDWDLGYPSTVELSDGSLLSVYYQKVHGNNTNCGVLYSVWNMPENFTKK